MAIRWRIPSFLFIAALMFSLQQSSVLSQDYEELLEEAQELFELQEYEEAVKAFKKANRLAGGKSPECMLGLARTFNRMGAFKNAAKEARRALDIAPDFEVQVRSYNQLGIALSASTKKKDLEEAELAFRKILELTDGESNMARYNLADVLIRQKRNSEAITLLQEFIDRDPDSPTADQARAIIENPRRATENFAPDFSFVTLDGEYFTLEDLQGKAVLLDFWATWCAPCVQALPTLKRLSKKMEKDPFFIVSISTEDQNVIEQYVEKKRMNWPHYRDERRRMIALFQSNVLPTYVLLDHEGIIVFQTTGWSQTKGRTLASQVSKAIKNAKKAQQE